MAYIQQSQKTNEPKHQAIFSMNIQNQVQNIQTYHKTSNNLKKIDLNEDIICQLSGFQSIMNNPGDYKTSQENFHCSKLKIGLILVISAKFSLVIYLLYLLNINQCLNFNKFLMISLTFTLFVLVVLIQIVSANWISENNGIQHYQEQQKIAQQIIQNQKTVSILNNNVKGPNKKKTLKFKQKSQQQPDNKLEEQTIHEINFKNIKTAQINYRNIQNSLFLLNILVSIQSLAALLLLIIFIFLINIESSKITSLIIIEILICALTLTILLLLWRINIAIKLFLNILKESIDKKIQLDEQILKNNLNQLPDRRQTTYRSMNISMRFIENQSKKCRNQQLFICQPIKKNQEDLSMSLQRNTAFQANIFNYSRKKSALKKPTKLFEKNEENMREKSDQIEEKKKVEINFNQNQQFNYSKSQISSIHSILTQKMQQQKDSRAEIEMIQNRLRTKQKLNTYQNKMLLKEKYEQQLIQKLRIRRKITQYKIQKEKAKIIKSPPEQEYPQFTQFY